MIRIISLYLGCYCLVICYVNTFGMWKWLRETLGAKADMLPVAAATAMIIISGMFLLHYKKKGKYIRGRWLVAAFFVTIAALFVPDPEFPVKRVHVVQYFLLALIVRYPLSFHLKDGWLSLFTVLVTILFGIHDELLQGLHPLRTFGIRDIGVNSCAAMGGACFAHGINIFAGNNQPGDNRADNSKKDHTDWFILSAILLVVTIAVAGLLIPLGVYKKTSIPPWLAAPLVGSLCGMILLIPELCKRGNFFHGLVVMFWLLFFLPFYQVIANMAMIEFN